jgi:hypothetical protein
MAYWFPELKLAFQCRIPTETIPVPIFYYEAATVTCAIIHPLLYTSPRLVVYTDNQNTVDIWHSLKASGPYNKLLITAIDDMINFKFEVRVVHVPGVDNIVADALSRFNNAYALRLVPDLVISTFQPPLGMLGAYKK